MSDVLILDDEKDDLVAMEVAAGSFGLTVTAVSDPVEFRHIAQVDPPRLMQIVDYEVPEIKQMDDISNVPELVAVTAAEGRHVPTVFLTSFGADCEGKVEDLDPRLVSAIVEKPIAPSKDNWHERLDVALAEIKSQPDFEEPQPVGVAVEDLGAPFFQLSPQEFDRLPEDEQEAREAQVSSELRSHVASAWDACSADWMMLQRIDGVVLVIDRGSKDEFPAHDHITEVERERGAPVLLIGRPRLIEEVYQGTIDCTPPVRRDWRHYPFVRLLLGEEVRDFHLDTGSPESFISREYLAECIGVPRGKGQWTIVSDVAGREQNLTQRPVTAELHVSGPRGNTEIPIVLQAVKDWHRAKMLNPRCPGARCPDSTDGQCGRRLGLMGRDLLYCLSEGGWQFDPQNGQFFAAGND